MSELKICSLNTGDACSQEQVYKKRKIFSERDIFLIERRSGTHKFQTICLRHERKFVTFYECKQNSCCDPYEQHPTKVRTALWTITSNFEERFFRKSPNKILQGNKLCIKCKLLIPEATDVEVDFFEPIFVDENTSNTSEQEIDILSSQTSTISLDESAACSSTIPLSQCTTSDMTSNLNTDLTVLTPPDLTLEKINNSLKLMNLDSVNINELRTKKLRIRKINEIISAYKAAFNIIAGIESNCDAIEEISMDIDYAEAGKQMIAQLKDKFSKTDTRNAKITILSVLPMSWTIANIQKEFGASAHMVRKTKELVKDQGVLCTVEPKRGTALSDEIMEKVKLFYLDPEISRTMPGKKDYISVLNGSKREHRQKRLILSNLKELHQHFLEKNPCIKISFSKFAELRPKECVLAGASGTHTVCVCTYHQNIKLMLVGSKLTSLHYNSVKFCSYKEYLQFIKCVSPTEDCHLRRCDICPGIDKLRDILIRYFEENLTDNITYKQWVQTDRCNLDIIVKPVDDFVDSFIEKLSNLSPHDYYAKKQSEYFRYIKENLTEDEVIVVADFSENYAFVVQDSAQGMHWNNSQATVHPFAGYFRRSTDDVIEPLNFVVISDDLNHNTTSVHFFQKLLTQFLKTKMPQLKKIIYMSDGAPSQYKNRYNVLNLCLHKTDFSVAAEWHFFETAHGKGPSDGLGGTLKRLAARASLQMPYENQIQTPKQLFDWAVSNISGITFGFATKSDIEQNSKTLTKRFSNAISIKGIRNYHTAIPQGNGFVSMKNHSFSEEQDFIKILEDQVQENTWNLTEQRVTRSGKRRRGIPNPTF